MNRVILLFFVIVFSSCSSTMITAVAITEIASLGITGKTADDNFASMATKKDCSIARWAKGGEYCVLKEKPYVAPKIERYCYQTLSDVDCYLEPLKNKNDSLLNR